MFAKHLLLIVAVLGLSATVQQTHARVFTVHNQCTTTLWPGIYTGDTANGKPDGIAYNGGWQLDAGQSSIFDVPDNWLAGRIWARTSCDFSKQDVQACSTGSCIGGLHCTQPGIPPVTLAEFTLSQSGQDNYDVSVVDGSNVAMEITTNIGCPTASCPVDLNANCPSQLQSKDATGTVVGCLSACKALGGDANCCSGANNLPETCPSSGVAYYHYFKDNCPNAYAYAYDESSGTALWTCSGGPSYTITFCP